MKDWPTDPIRQNNRLIAAFCDDLFDMCVNRTSGTPRADRVCEISRQVNSLTPASDAHPLGVTGKPVPAIDAGRDKGGEE